MRLVVAQKTLSAIIALGLGLALSIPVEAVAEGTEGIYGGLSIGQGQIRGGKDFCNNVAQTAGVIVSQCDDLAWGYRIFGGYEFNPYLAAELGYNDLGRYNISGMVGGIAGNAQAKATTLDLTAVGRLPLGERVSLFAKGGAAWYQLKDSGNIGAANASASSDGWAPTYGIGASWQPWDRRGYYALAFRLEFQRFQHVGDPNITGQANVNFYSLSIVVF